MDDLEGKFSQLLSDPAKLAEVMNMAQSLMGQLGQSAPAAEATQAAAPQASTVTGAAPAPQEQAAPAVNLEQAMPSSVMTMLQQANNLDGKEAALFNALKPFLKPSRREKIDKAMRIARLSHLAGFALRNLDI